MKFRSTTTTIAIPNSQCYRGYVEVGLHVLLWYGVAVAEDVDPESVAAVVYHAPGHPVREGAVVTVPLAAYAPSRLMP